MHPTMTHVLRQDVGKNYLPPATTNQRAKVQPKASPKAAAPAKQAPKKPQAVKPPAKRNVLAAKAPSAPRKMTQVASTRKTQSRVPVGQPTQPLRMAKKGGKQTPEDMIHSRLKKKSPWYQSLLNPLHGADVKIPDAVGVETGTLQCVQRVSVQVNGHGIAGCETTCLHPNLMGGGPAAQNFRTTTADAEQASITWEELPLPFDTQDALQSFSRGVRVVSAAVYAQSEASLATNQGLITSYVAPYPPALAEVGLTYFQNLYKTSMTPTNSNDPAVSRFYPIKQNGAEYDMFYVPTNVVGPGYDTDGPETPFWEMGHIISGAEVGTIWLFTIVVNYEFMPFENAINILDASPSPNDAQEVDLVENWVQDMPPTTMTSNRIVATPPMSSETPEPGEGTGFGMFFEVISELAPLALALL